MLHRREVVQAIADARTADTLIVSGLGSPTWDVAAAGNHPGNFQFVGTMGQAVPFGFGLALAQPDKRIVVITGDGELLMSLGVLATIAALQPTNLVVTVLDNEVYMETGGQPTATAGPTDLAAVAAACGFPMTMTFTEPGEISELLRLCQSAPGPVLAVAKVVSEKLPMAFPASFDGATAMNRFRAHIAESPTD